MDIKYDISKFKNSKIEKAKDSVSIEEPLEMRLKYKIDDKWQTQNLSITMRTPGNDEDLVRGFLYNERIIENINQIENIEKQGDDVGDYNLKNTIQATINNIQNLEIGKLKRNFLTNSSCGVCGKTSLDSIEVIKDEKLDLSYPLINEKIILNSPKLLINEQSEFAKTGGIHASALINQDGSVVATREDVGRHNAVDKIAGYMFINNIKNTDKIFYTTGRLTSEMVIKTVKMGIPILISRSGFTAWGVDLAKKTNLTLIGRAKGKKYIILSGHNRVN